MKKEKEFVVYYHKYWLQIKGPIYHKTVYAESINEAVLKVIHAANEVGMTIRIYGVFVPVPNNAR